MLKTLQDYEKRSGNKFFRVHVEAVYEEMDECYYVVVDGHYRDFYGNSHRETFDDGNVYASFEQAEEAAERVYKLVSKRYKAEIN